MSTIKQCKKCNEIFPSFVKVKDKKIDMRNRSYCLTCSPFGERRFTRGAKYVRENGKEGYCAGCNLWKKLDEFYRRNDSRRKSQKAHICKKCQLNLNETTYKSLKKRAIEDKGGKCERCGYNKFMGALGFHHRSGSEKQGNLSRMFRNFKDFTKLKEELDKCDLLCVRCHRIAHFKNYEDLTSQGKKYRKLKLKWVAIKGGKCENCGFDQHISAFDFHHTREKLHDFSEMAFKNLKIIETEMEKCILLCSNCHAEHHFSDVETALSGNKA